jgi:amphi-Trp domain-containing protein
MPEEQLFKTAEAHSRDDIADALIDVAEEIRTGTVHLESPTDDHEVAIPETPRFEVELERLTDSETGDIRYELEYEIRWTG